MNRFTKQQVFETAEKLGICGHCFPNWQEFGESISEFIEHTERIVPPTRVIKGDLGFPDIIVGNPNAYLHLAMPKRMPPRS